MSISGRKYLVLGASGGVGREVSRRLLESGAFVSALVREEAEVSDLAQAYPESFHVARWCFEDGSSGS